MKAIHAGVGYLGYCLAGLTGVLAAAELTAQDSPNRLPPLPIVPPRQAAPSPIKPRAQAVAASPRAVIPPAAPSPLVAPGIPPAPAPPPLAALPIAAIPPAQTPPNPGAIKWDAETKDYKAIAGDTSAHFTFWLTNVSSSEVLVNSVRTSCGCTVAQLPSQPWHIPAGGDGPIQVTVNLLGKSGLIAKGVTVDTSAGIKQLTVRVDIPPGAGIMAPPVATVSGSMNDGERLKNMQLALTDRQVLFKNQDCAKCHADPAKGLTDGRLVYTAVCATCHNSHLRASMVPDLRTLSHATDADFWRKWITYGRAGSMMPAFAVSEGGPLSEQQVNALVDFMGKAFPSHGPLPGPTTARAPGATASAKPLQR